MEDPRLLQKAIYGAAGGPPMLYEPPTSKSTPPRRCKRRKRDPPQQPSATEQSIRILKERGRTLSLNPTQLSPGDLPGDFPPQLAFRALAAYSLLRTLSIPLRLSPFTPNVFLRALYLPCPNKLMGQVHVALLRILLPQLGYTYKPRGRNMHKRRTVDNLRWPLLAGDNLIYLDGLSWPFFYDDYCHLTADRLWASYHDDGTHLDFRCHGMQPLDVQEFQYDYAAFDDNDEDNDDDDDTETTSSHSEQDPIVVESSHSSHPKGHHQQQRKRQRRQQLRQRGQPHGRNHRYATIPGSNSDSEGDDKDDEEDDPDDHDEIWNQRRSRPKPRTRTRDIRGTELLRQISPSSKVKDVEVPTRWGLHASTPTQQWKDSFVSPTYGPVPAVTEQFLTAMPQKNLFQAHDGTRTLSNSKSSLGDKEPSLQNPGDDQVTPKELPVVVAESRPSGSVDFSNTLPADSHGEQQHSSSPTQIGSAAQSNVEVMHPFDPTFTSTELANSNRVTPEDGNLMRLTPGLKGLNRRKLPTITNKITTSTATRSRFKLPLSSPNKPPLNGLGEDFLLQESQSSQLQQEIQLAQFHQQSQMGGTHALKSQYSDHSLTGNYNSKSQIPQQYKHMRPRESSTNWQSLNATTNQFTTQRTRAKKRALEVDDDVARALRDFVTGTENSSAQFSKGHLGTSSVNGSSCDFEKKVKQEQWIHFAPLKAMRDGVPYHRLSPKRKLVILEFLIDQLLSMEAFAAEFTRRREIEEGSPHPYGTWPNDAALENLENADECGICNGEGELLCCDGCIASYHRQCLDIPPEQQPPEGKWLCPECRLVDPALLGPLGLGSKASLDWFTLEDIAVAPQRSLTHMQMTSTSQYLHQPHFALSNLYATSSEIGAFMSSLVTEQTIAAVQSSNTTLPMLTPGLADFPSIPPQFQGKQFLVIHGYLFCRSEEHMDGLIELLPRNTLLKMLDLLQPGTRKAWPLAQIPQNEESLRVHFPTTRQYLLPLESHDPNAYHTKYCKAPMTVLMISGAATQLQQSINMDPESELNMHKFHKLSDCLIRDFTLDNLVAKSLRLDRLLCDPYELFKTHLTRLDMTLRRACLLHEFWEAGTERSRQDRWLIRVRKARSINRLAKLLLQLVDSAHPRAFGEGWFHNPLLKGDEVVVDTGRHFEDLPNDWSEQLESKKRLWERIPPESILRLCEKEKSSLEGFVQGVREHASKPLVVSRSKRKQVKTSMPSPLIQNEVFSAPDHDAEPTQPAQLSELDTVAMHRMHDASFVNDVSKSETIEPPLLETNSHDTINQDTMDTDDYPDNEGALAFNNVTSAEANNSGEPNSVDSHRPFEENDNQNHTSLSPVSSVTNNADTSATPKPKKKGRPSTKKQRSDASTPASRRTRRSLGRFSTVAPETEITVQEAPHSETLAVKSIILTAQSMQAHIETFKLRKVPQIEKIVKGGFQKQMEWPICGRIPFATMGNLPPHEMKRLGRNGGVVKAPYVAYQSNHEVGQVCFSHIWRRQTSQCYRFEDLWSQLRVLESFIDRATIQTCENVVRRGKNQVQKVVKITQRDPANGIIEHFVLSKAKQRGCWISSEHMDVSGLIIEAYNRRQNQIDRRQVYLQQKKQIQLLQQREKEMALKVAQQKLREKAMAEARVKLEAETIAKARVKAELDAKAHAAQKAIKSMTMFQQGGQDKLMPSTNGIMGVHKWNDESKTIRTQQHLNIGKIAQHSVDEVTYPIPASGLNAVTQKSIVGLQHAAVTQGDLRRPKQAHNSAGRSKLKSLSSGVSSSNGQSQQGMGRLSHPALEHGTEQSNMSINSQRRQHGTSNGGMVVQELAFDGSSSRSMMHSSQSEHLRGFPRESSAYVGNQLPGTSNFQQHALGIHNTGTGYSIGQQLQGTNQVQANLVNQAWFGRENQFIPDTAQNIVQQQLHHMNMAAQSITGPYLGNLSTQVYQIQQPVTAYSNTPFGFPTIMQQQVELQQQQGHGLSTQHPQATQHPYQNQVQNFVSQGPQIQQEQNVQMLQSELHRLQQLRQLQQQQQQQQQSQLQGFPPQNHYW